MFTIRIAKSPDLAQAAGIYDRALRDADWLPEASRTKGDFWSATCGEDVFVACDADRGVIGFVSVWKADSFIHHLYVDAEFRRLGVGTALLASLHDWLPQPWTLKCVAANESALAFYQSLGWILVTTDHGPDGAYHLLRFGPAADAWLNHER